ncbi:hypothetical protein [Spirillospora albida]|uniref:hypothetical protein n=1 Tax=Spirillospora albida TaxID=58123 RepID=UPI00068FA58A|nr:hypothetical protein [Spirillospora albida]
MADIYDFFLAFDLRELSEHELAELRWHLGLGPRPEELTIITDFDTFEPDEDDSPFPVLARRGAARRISGAVFSLLEARENGWALTTRQELHPDEFDEVEKFLAWLGTKGDYDYRAADGSTKGGGFGQFVGYIRWYEDAAIEKLLAIDDFQIVRRDP